MGVNMVAGGNNQQGNLAAIAKSGPAVIQFGQLNQSTTNLERQPERRHPGSALSQNRGLVGINQGRVRATSN